MEERKPEEQKSLDEYSQRESQNTRPCGTGEVDSTNYGQGEQEEKSAAGDEPPSGSEEEEREAFSFLQETIKPKPVTGGQIALQLVKVAVYGLIIGVTACCGFYAVRPWAEETFHEEAQEVTLPKDEEEVTEPVSEEEEEKEPEPEPQIIVPELTADSYREIMQSMYAVAKEADRCVVYVRKAKEGENQRGAGAHTGTTGIVAADNGQELLILSDNSVCEGTEQWAVIFPDHTRYTAKLVKQDGNRGLAVFGIDRASISESTWNVVRVAELGNSNISVRGDLVIAVGQMFGYENGLGYGIISAKEWDHDYADGQCGVIATDISASPGASGVLFNQKGQVIGLVKGGILGEGASALVNALEVSDMKQVMGLLLNGETVPYTGIFGTAVTDELSEEKKIPKGLYVTNVQADSPAMKAGIQNGDVILEVGANSVTGIVSYEKAVLECRAGEAVKVKGQRLGSGGYVEVDFTVTMGSME